MHIHALEAKVWEKIKRAWEWMNDDDGYNNNNGLACGPTYGLHEPNTFGS